MRLGCQCSGSQMPLIKLEHPITTQPQQCALFFYALNKLTFLYNVYKNCLQRYTDMTQVIHFSVI